MKKDKSQNPEQSFKTQLLRVFASHAQAVITIFLIGFFLLAAIWSVKILDKIFGTLLLLSYGLSLYSSGYACAEYDHKSYSKTKAYPYKGILLSLLIPLSNFIVWAIMKLLWTTNPGTVLTEIPALIGNIIFVAWTFPYNFFMNFTASHMNIAGHISLYLFPVFAVSLGYFCGYKKWDFTSKLSFLVYEKKKK